MNKFRLFVRDVLYVSKATGTGNKKRLILTSVILSQITALMDIFIIMIFSVIIVNEFSGIIFVDEILTWFQVNNYLLILIVIIRFIFLYFKSMILRKIELNVMKNLKVYLLSEIFDKKNYSTSDSFYYINTLSTHISFFYSNFASFLNSILQIGIYSAYLLISEPLVVFYFGIGIFFLIYPIQYLLKKSRGFMHDSYIEGQYANKSIQRVIENTFIIQLLSKQEEEISKFGHILDKFKYFKLQNIRYGIFNTLLPSFLAMFILSILLILPNFKSVLTLVFIGVTLRLFQSLSNLSTNLNNIINSHVHIEKFYEFEQNKIVHEKSNYLISNTDSISLKNVTFQYFNSDEPIFENLNLKIPKNTNTIITGPNGSGKSTLLGIIAGIFHINQGTVNCFSNKFSYVGANPIIFDSTLRENICYGLKKEISDNEIINLMKYFEIFKENTNYDLNKKIHTRNLSSGQMQKIAFIRAIISKPEILILDESTANLDELTKNKVVQTLSELQITIINSTHDPQLFSDADLHLKINIEDEKRVVELTNKIL